MRRHKLVSLVFLPLIVSCASKDISGDGPNKGSTSGTTVQVITPTNQVGTGNTDTNLACRTKSITSCLQRYPRVYATYNQQCDDPRTHYLVRRNEKVEMKECYGVPNYKDCVGACFQYGDQVLQKVCENDAESACRPLK